VIASQMKNFFILGNIEGAEPCQELFEEFKMSIGVAGIGMYREETDWHLIEFFRSVWRVRIE
jgi:hypothetical protein